MQPSSQAFSPVVQWLSSSWKWVAGVAIYATLIQVMDVKELQSAGLL